MRKLIFITLLALVTSCEQYQAKQEFNCLCSLEMNSKLMFRSAVKRKDLGTIKYAKDDLDRINNKLNELENKFGFNRKEWDAGKDWVKKAYDKCGN